MPYSVLWRTISLLISGCCNSSTILYHSRSASNMREKSNNAIIHSLSKTNFKGRGKTKKKKKSSTNPFADLVYAIHYTIKQADHLITDKSWSIFLNKVATVERNNRPDSLAFIRDACQSLVVSLPYRVGICHRQRLGRVQRACNYRLC
jgi:hypothetical protein